MAEILDHAEILSREISIILLIITVSYHGWDILQKIFALNSGYLQFAGSLEIIWKSTTSL